MLRRIAALILIMVSASFPVFSSDELENVIRRAVDEIIPVSDEPIVISVETITYADSGIGSGFSLYLQEMISFVCSESESLEVFSSDRLGDVIAAQKQGLIGLFDESAAAEIGVLKSVRALLGGRYFSAGTEVHLFLELVDVESGTVLGKKQVSFPRTKAPTNTQLIPDDYDDAMFVIEELSEVQSTGAGALVVKAWTKRGNGAVYREGEQLEMKFYASTDCFIKIFHIDAERKMKLIFPNPYYTYNRIEGRRIYTIPDSNYPFTFNLTAPYGTEMIKVFASTVQFPEIEEPFSDLGQAGRELATRGLNVAARPEQVAEALINYTIVK